MTSSETTPLLEAQSQNVIALGLVQFKPQVSFVHNISRIAEKAGKKYDFEHWTGNAQRFVYSQPSELRYVHFDHARVQFQTLDLTTWLDRLEQHCDMVKMALDAYELGTVTEVTCKFDAFLDLEMNQAELADLGFGCCCWSERKHRVS